MDVLGNGVERGEVAGVREGGPELGGSLRVKPQSAVARSMLRLRLAPKTSHTVAPVWRRTFVATACGRRSSSA